MKKLIYTAIALAAVAVGCTKSDLVEVPEAQKTPITFETYTGKAPVTKASSVSTLTLCECNASSNPAFHVNAYTGAEGSYVSYIDQDMWCSGYTYNEETKEINNATWESTYKTYWPNTNTLTFVAYGSNADKTFTGVNNNTFTDWNELGTSFTYNVPPKVSEQEDLIVAVPVTQNVNTNSGVVSLNFKHLLSRVGFSLRTTGTDGTVTIKSIKLNGAFYPSGSVNLLAVTPAISVEEQEASVTSYSLFDSDYSSTATTYDYFICNSPGDRETPIFANHSITQNDEGGTVDTPNTDDSNRYMMIIPSNQSADATIEVVYQLSGASEVTKSVKLSETGFTFTAGYAYEFIIKILSEAIEFTGSVVEWDQPQTISEYN